MRKYPIGLQSFREIVTGGYVYVDKTEKIHELVSSGKYYFFSRPRRFGKSLLLSTLKELYSGNRELFKDLWIENKWDWTRQNPIINIRFASLNYEKKGLEQALLDEIIQIGKKLDLAITSTYLKDAFQELIQKASANGKVVILIDEYDKPIIDYINDERQADENRLILKSFYSILKDNDDFIELLFITGVGKFTKVSIFSDLNNLKDISINRQYSTLVGITQKELEHNFTEEIQCFQKETPAILSEIKTWYNGYSWTGDQTVYNPFSILNFMTDGVFKIYWFETGTPTFLIEQIKKRNDFTFENVEANLSNLSDLQFSNISPTALLFQTGYLTITEYDAVTRSYTLNYPNFEVKSSLLECLVSAYSYEEQIKTTPLVIKMYRAFIQNKLEDVVKIINVLFSSIPYDLWRNATELHYHALTHLIFNLLGTYVESEVHTSEGRCDMLIKTNTHIYALEFKLDEPAELALAQIKTKHYLAPYTLDNREKVMIGISFSSEHKKIDTYLVELIN